MIYLLPGYLKKVVVQDVLDLNLHKCDFITGIMLNLEKKNIGRIFKNEVIFEKICSELKKSQTN